MPEGPLRALRTGVTGSNASADSRAVGKRRPPRRFGFVAALALLFPCVDQPYLCAGEPLPLARLRSYVRIDTTNPPGNERQGALYLQGILEESGIPSEIYESAPHRANLYARLKGTGGKPGLLLHHHIDVVPAAEKGWSSPPFEARIANGRVVGRGVVDDKMLGIAHLEAFLFLKRSRRPLSRDVVFLATADEEKGSRFGVEAILKERPAWLRGIGYALGEGGGSETVVQTQRYFGVETFEKSTLWIRLVSTEAGGHGAITHPSNAAARIGVAVGKLATWRRPIVLEPEIEDYFRSLAPVRPPSVRALLHDIPRLAQRQPEELERRLSPFQYSLVADTFSVTRLGSDSPATNVRSSKAWAELDCRLLPRSDIDEFLRDLKVRMSDPGITVEILLRAAAGPPSPRGEFFEVIRATLGKRFPGAAVGPSPSAGISDNRFFRASGIVTYGLLPFRINYYDAAGVHAANERIRADWFVEGVETMTEVVAAFAGTPTGKAAEDPKPVAGSSAPGR